MNNIITKSDSFNIKLMKLEQKLCLSGELLVKTCWFFIQWIENAQILIKEIFGCLLERTFYLMLLEDSFSPIHY